MVASGIGAGCGILIKGGKPFEQAGKVGVVAFDKTGTLTKGQPAVVGVHLFGDLGETELLRAVGSAEAHSEHPLAQAMVEYVSGRLGTRDGRGAGDAGAEVKDVTWQEESGGFEMIPGRGVVCRVGSKAVVVRGVGTAGGAGRL